MGSHKGATYVKAVTAADRCWPCTDLPVRLKLQFPLAPLSSRVALPGLLCNGFCEAGVRVRERRAFLRPIPLRRTSSVLLLCFLSLCLFRLEYAYESAESFYDEVLSAALGFGDLNAGGDGDGAFCPYSVLGLPRGAPLSQVRCVLLQAQAYLPQ